MCEQLGVARSSFYAWRTRLYRVTASAVRREALKVRVAEIYQEHRGVYGCRRIAAELVGQGETVSVGLVVKLMRELGLAGIQTRAYKRTTTSSKVPLVFPDLVAGKFTASEYQPGEALVGDITYLRTGEGWLYLATVIDL